MKYFRSCFLPFLILTPVGLLIIFQHNKNKCALKENKTDRFHSKLGSLIDLLSNASDEQALIDKNTLITTIRYII